MLCKSHITCIFTFISHYLYFYVHFFIFVLRLYEFFFYYFEHLVCSLGNMLYHVQYNPQNFPRRYSQLPSVRNPSTTTTQRSDALRSPLEQTNPHNPFTTALCPPLLVILITICDTYTNNSVILNYIIMELTNFWL